jgi:hypothetical protein
METPKNELLAERNRQIFLNLKKAKPRGLGLSIISFDLTSYQVSPNSGKFQAAVGWLDIKKKDLEGNYTNEIERRPAAWNIEGLCLQPTMQGPSGTTRSFPDADLVETIEP